MLLGRGQPRLMLLFGVMKLLLVSLLSLLQTLAMLLLGLALFLLGASRVKTLLLRGALRLLACLLR